MAASGPGTYEISPDVARDLHAELCQTRDALGKCNDTFCSTPVPPGSSPPVVQAAVVAALTTLYEMCADAFRKGEEKVSKLCDDVETAIKGYEDTDDRTSQDVDDSVEDTPDGPTGDGTTNDSGGGDTDSDESETDSGDEVSDYRKEADEDRYDRHEDPEDDTDSDEGVSDYRKEINEEVREQQETPGSDPNADTEEDGAEKPEDVQPVTLLTGNHAANMSGAVDGRHDDIEDMYISPKARAASLAEVADPIDAFAPEAERDDLAQQGQMIKDLLKPESLASGNLSDADVNIITNGSAEEVAKFGLKHSAESYGAAVDDFESRYNGWLDKYDAEAALNGSSDDDDDNSGSDD
ncbi:MAG: hypothetical protein ACRCZD_12300 [Phycicoccus sp.]